MLDLDFLKSCGHFKEITLKKDEVLFDEWSIDNNFYIIENWIIAIEKYTTIERKETKELALLTNLDIIWEASLNSDNPKEAKAKVKQETKLLVIEAKTWFAEFINDYPKEWLEVLKYIIKITNKRLSKANRQITANYEIIKSIINIESISNKCIFWIIEKIKLITWFDYILYFELNPVMKDYLTLKYDTREKWKLQDTVIERWKMWSLKELDEIVLKNYTFVQKLNIWNIDLWFMIFWKSNLFDYEDKKLIVSISNSLTWLLKEKENLKDEKNKNYIKNW